MKNITDSRQNTKRADRQTRVWPVVTTAVVITIIALAAVFGQDAIRYFRAKDTQDQLKDMYKGSSAASIWDAFFPGAAAEEAQELSADSAENEPEIQEDFTELYAQNPHLVGWLSAGDRIDYPVVQYDDEYYLNHDYFGNEDSGGTLFVNSANRFNPRDSILLIHGHNMKNGTMFGGMNSFRQYDYLSKYPIVSFRTIWDAEDVYYTPVAAFDASMNPSANGYFDITNIRFDFDIPADEDSGPKSSELENHIAQMRELSIWNSPVEADSTDEYITLVTCSYQHDNGRMMLLCRKLRSGETPEDISELYRDN